MKQALLTSNNGSWYATQSHNGTNTGEVPASSLVISTTHVLHSFSICAFNPRHSFIMVATSMFLFTGFVVAVSATPLSYEEDDHFAILLKRQAPGTPAYDCHDNCGMFPASTLPLLIC
jgi:hypothetical protein